tara:strand:+ start:3826 stop:4767 length:942 start_codon:yes stop_codon:yes gene_type:complete
MRPWRKLYASVLTSDKIDQVDDGSALLYMMLLTAQDDLGRYPWTPSMLRSLTLTRRWDLDQIDAFRDQLIDVGLIDYSLDPSPHVMIVNGAELNGQPHNYSRILLYPIEHPSRTRANPRETESNPRELESNSREMPEIELIHSQNDELESNSSRTRANPRESVSGDEIRQDKTRLDKNDESEEFVPSSEDLISIGSSGAPVMELPNSLSEWMHLMGQTDPKNDQVALLVNLADRHWPWTLPPNSGGKAAALLNKSPNAFKAVETLWSACSSNTSGDVFEYALGILKEGGSHGRSRNYSTANSGTSYRRQFPAR